MGHPIHFDSVDALGAGALGDPGSRVFYIQAQQLGERLTVVVEKQQVALLAQQVTDFLDRIAEDYPEETMGDFGIGPDGGIAEPAVPLFRARMIGLGFEPDRGMVLIELRERGDDEDEDGSDSTEEGFVARIFASREQVRAMAACGVEAVAGGRPPCPLCTFPMDLEGHICPRWN